jgi:hypothetical protein
MMEHGETIPEPKTLDYHLLSGEWERSERDIYAVVNVAIPELAL